MAVANGLAAKTHGATTWPWRRHAWHGSRDGWRELFTSANQATFLYGAVLSVSATSSRCACEHSSTAPPSGLPVPISFVIRYGIISFEHRRICWPSIRFTTGYRLPVPRLCIHLARTAWRLAVSNDAPPGVWHASTLRLFLALASSTLAAIHGAEQASCYRQRPRSSHRCLAHHLRGGIVYRLTPRRLAWRVARQDALGAAPLRAYLINNSART